MEEDMRHVALIIDTNRSYGRGLLRGIRTYVSEHGPWSIYLDLRSLDSSPPTWLNKWNGDGILVRTGNRAVAEAVEKAGLPAVQLRTSHLVEGQPFVGVDNSIVGRMVTNHFIQRGYHNFAVYGIGTEDAYEERQQSFVKAVNDAGFECAVFEHPIKGEKHRDWERTQNSVAEWVSHLQKPVGVMACTDQLGFWLLDACKRANVSVPEDVAVVSCENDEALATMSSPPMSSVQFQAEATGYKACEILERLMSGEPAPAPILIPPLRINVRQSSDIVAVEDEDTAAALLYIRQHATDGISVEDILEQVPVSRASLDQRMKQAIGRTAKAEIIRVQLERVKQMLVETDLTLDQIARHTGFRHPQYMAEFFKKKVGKTPGAYRSDFQS